MKRDEVQDFRQGVDTLKEAIRKLVGEIQEEELQKVGKKIDSVNDKVSKLQGDFRSQKGQGERIRDYVDSTLKDNSDRHKDRFIRMESSLREMVSGLKGNVEGIGAAMRAQEEMIKRMDTRMGVLEQRFFDLKKDTTVSKENMIREFDKFRSEFSSFDSTAIERAVQSDLQRTAANLRKEMADERRGVESASARITSIEQSFHEVERLKSFMDTIDLRGLRRDMEILKTRQKWIEENLEHVNLTPLHDKLTEIEGKVRNIRTGMPTVIE